MAEPNEKTTVIGPDTQIKGDMTFDSSARVLGRIEGKIKGKGQLHVAEGARCTAELDASQIVVDGTVDGNIRAAERVQLNAQARVTGDLVAAKLVVAEGASFNGHVNVGADAAKAPGKTEQAPAQAQPASAGQPEPAKK